GLVASRGFRSPRLAHEALRLAGRAHGPRTGLGPIVRDVAAAILDAVPRQGPYLPVASDLRRAARGCPARGAGPGHDASRAAAPDGRRGRQDGFVVSASLELP